MEGEKEIRRNWLSVEIRLGGRRGLHNVSTGQVTEKGRKTIGKKDSGDCVSKKVSFPLREERSWVKESLGTMLNRHF